MPGVCGVGKVAEVVTEGNIAIQIAAQVSNRGISKIRGIDALRKQGKGVEEVQVLGVVIEAECGFDFAAANAEPTSEAVIGDGPVQGGMVLVKLAEIAVVDSVLRPGACR